MKSSSQIKAFLTNKKPTTDTDKWAIIGYTKSIHGLYNVLDDNSNKTQTISFIDYKQWLETELPELNDVVVINEGEIDIIGIVSDVLGVNKIVLGAYLSPSGFSTKHKAIDLKNYRFADSDEKIKLQSEFNKNKKRWFPRSSTVYPAYYPKINDWVKVTLLGDRFAIGVFKEITEAGDIVLFCYLKDSRVSCQGSEILCKTHACQFEKVSIQERDILKKALVEKGLVWNGRKQICMPILPDPIEGEEYFYIDFKSLNVKKAVNKNNKQSKERLDALNYYKNKADAEEILNNHRTGLNNKFQQLNT